jgi:hypothetical protein
MLVLLIISILGFVVCLYFLGNLGSRDVREGAKIRESRYGVNLPWWVAVWRRIGAGSRIKLLETIKQENLAHMSVLSTESEIQRVELESKHVIERVEEIRQVESATRKNLLTTANRASELAVSPLALDEIRKDQEKSQTKVIEHREMKEVDKNVYRFEKEIDVKGAIVAKVVPVFEMEALMKQLEGELGKLEYWMSLPESYQQKQMVTQLKRNVRLIREAIDARGQGLIQGNSPPQLGPMDED